MACQSAKGPGGNLGAYTHKLRVSVSPPASSLPGSKSLLALAQSACLVHGILTTSGVCDCVMVAREFAFNFVFACVCV